MGKEQRKPSNAEVTQLSFRLWPPYSQMVVRQAAAAGMRPTQFARLATMAMVDSGLLSLAKRLGRVEDELIRLRKDFNDSLH